MKQIATLSNGWKERSIHRASGLVQNMFDETQSVSSTQESASTYLAHLGAIRNPATDCVFPFEGKMLEPDKLLGKEQIGGVLADKVQVGTNTGLISWYAPSLGCLPLKHARTFSDSTSSLVFDNLTFTEPDPALFTIDPSYKELPPSQALFRHLQYGKVPDQNINQMVANMAKADLGYAAKRPR